MRMTNDLKQFENFQFIDPGTLIDKDLELRLQETCPCNPEKMYVPEYKFEMIHATTKATMGTIDLRVGLTEKLKEIGGHIGYEVAEPYRGHKYAARSLRLLFPLIQELGIQPVVITCDPENMPSVKTIESIGAKLIVTQDVEIEPHMWRPTSIYHLYLRGQKTWKRHLD
jgi:predicted acetyltransferase